MKRFSTQYIAKVAVLSAMSIITYCFLRFPIFPPPFNVLDLDFSRVFSLIGGFAFGPIAALIIETFQTIGKISLQGLSFSGIGDLSNYLVGLSSVLPAALIYKYHKTIKGALVALVVSVFTGIIFSSISNYFIIIPLIGSIPGLEVYMEIRVLFSFGIGVLFNLIKGASCAIVTLFLYKRLSGILHWGRDVKL